MINLSLQKPNHYQCWHFNEHPRLLIDQKMTQIKCFVNIKKFNRNNPSCNGEKKFKKKKNKTATLGVINKLTKIDYWAKNSINSNFINKIFNGKKHS
jgi:hypothetical protein